MITLPFIGDQSVNSILLGENHWDAGIELLQFRSGDSVKKTKARRGIEVVGTTEARREEMHRALTRMRAGEAAAERKRRNTERLGRIWRDSRKEGGSAWRALTMLDAWMKENDGVRQRELV
ncbi:glycosyltransferase family 1 protein [Atractiella rhizophila]|nr:glycosyltransferase family 1 protein [Atractiella rhizophila]